MIILNLFGNVHLFPSTITMSHGRECIGLLSRTDEWKHLFQQVDGDFNRNYFALFDVGVDELTKLRAGAAALLSQQVSGRQVSVAVVLSTGERRVQ